MLKLFRHKNVVKMVLWGLLILILPAFVLWGTGNLGDAKNKGPRFVGTIHDRKVSFEDLANSLVCVRAQLILNFYDRPKVLESLLNNKPLVGRLGWDRMLMLGEARYNRIRASDKEVIDYVKALPIFLRDGKFDEKFYQYILRHNLAMTPRGFEEMMRENLQITKLNNDVSKDVKVTGEEVAESYRKENQKIRVSYLFIPYADFTSKVTVTDEELKDYYESRKGELMMRPNDENAGPARPATFEEAKAALEGALREERAISLAIKYAEDEYRNVLEKMKMESTTFENAARRLGYKPKDSPLFAKGDSISAEEIDDTSALVEAAGDMKTGDISTPLRLKKGIVIFKLAEIQKIDEEKFAKEREDYSKKVLDKKKEAFLSNWLRTLESQAVLNIDLNDYEKYYR